MLQAGKGEIGQVALLHRAQSAGVGGKNGGRHRANLYTHHRQGGQDDRKGAASEAGQVVDSSDPLRTIGHDRHLQWQKYKDYAQYSTFSIKKANYTKENCQQILGKYAEKSALDLTFLTKTIWSER